jgi:hypothetical protein
MVKLLVAVCAVIEIHHCEIRQYRTGYSFASRASANIRISYLDPVYGHPLARLGMYARYAKRRAGKKVHAKF